MTDGTATAKGRALVALARRAIARALELEAAGEPEPDGDWLLETGAAFVTVTLDGTLRGCIGTVDAHRPLGLDVRDNAVNAALRDPRFPPLAPEEFSRARLSVSVLSSPEPIAFTDEGEALAALRPGIDGVVLEVGGRRATFLPQVWEQLGEPAAFLRALKRKAGLAEDHWDGTVRLYRYTVERHGEGA